MAREYYVNVAKALFRGHAMLQLSHMLLSMRGNLEYHQRAATDERTDFTGQYGRFREAILDILNQTSRDLWKCNPNPYLNNREC